MESCEEQALLHLRTGVCVCVFFIVGGERRGGAAQEEEAGYVSGYTMACPDRLIVSSSFVVVDVVVLVGFVQSIYFDVYIRI